MRALSTLLWLPVNAAQALFAILWSGLWIPLALVATALSGGPRIALQMARWAWSPGTLAAAGARLAIEGREAIDRGRSYLYVANHQSWIDIPALFVALPPPLAFVAKQELARVPLLGRFIAGTGMVFVDRGFRRGALQAVSQAERVLASGGSLLSFPEGTRSRDGSLGRFKSGVFQAAIAAGVDVVPVALSGSGAVIPPGGFRVRPGRIRIRIGEPIPSAAANRGELAAAAERAIERLLERSSTVARPSR